MSIKINRVYTRSGDKGETALVGGKRVKKNNLRVECYGNIDELNSVLGIVKEKLNHKTSEIESLILNIQQELFDLGSELATASDFSYPEMWKASESHTTKLEKLCDRYGDGLPELNSFILPGGSELSAFLHLARTVCRRAERSSVALLEEEKINIKAITYLNRLSDLLFILSRWVLTKEGKTTPLWIKEKDRK
jgi:cob(I)alamin adenosyltransferase